MTSQLDMFGGDPVTVAQCRDDALAALNILTGAGGYDLHWLMAQCPQSIHLEKHLYPKPFGGARYCYSLSPVQDGRPGTFPIVAIWAHLDTDASRYHAGIFDGINWIVGTAQRVGTYMHWRITGTVSGNDYDLAGRWVKKERS